MSKIVIIKNPSTFYSSQLLVRSQSLQLSTHESSCQERVYKLIVCKEWKGSWKLGPICWEQKLCGAVISSSGIVGSVCLGTISERLMFLWIFYWTREWIFIALKSYFYSQKNIFTKVLYIGFLRVKGEVLKDLWIYENSNCFIAFMVAFILCYKYCSWKFVYIL